MKVFLYIIRAFFIFIFIGNFIEHAFYFCVRFYLRFVGNQLILFISLYAMRVYVYIHTYNMFIGCIFTKHKSTQYDRNVLILLYLYTI